MKIYFAGTPGIKKREKNWQKIISARLLSYWDIIIKTHRAGDYAFKLIKNENTSSRSARRRDNRRL